MAECECLPRCPFFNDKMQNMPSLASMMKKRYCLGDSSECARHIVFLALGSEKVPSDLFPSQVDRARQIVSGQ
ncbi:hypothetical protein [Marispirochaeta aestuarii]|uniref:hypothetical protein n=1 Tax=Marispirochaeta aestuarii TaxID=1963862 RepID=UPI0029C6E046|nr:hypothetical protein [Marispirochaeta aestuarii]